LSDGYVGNIQKSTRKITQLAYSELFHHEHFHHKVECLATRIESLTRKPYHKAYIDAFYKPCLGSDNLLEEALANAYAFHQVFKIIEPKHWPESMMRLYSTIEYQQLLSANHMPPGYRMFDKVFEPRSFSDGCTNLYDMILNSKQFKGYPVPNHPTIMNETVSDLLQPFDNCRKRTFLVVPNIINHNQRSSHKCPHCGFHKYAEIEWGMLTIQKARNQSRKELENIWDSGTIPKIRMGCMMTGQSFSCIGCGYMW